MRGNNTILMSTILFQARFKRKASLFVRLGLIPRPTTLFSLVTRPKNTYQHRNIIYQFELKLLESQNLLPLMFNHKPCFNASTMRKKQNIFLANKQPLHLWIMIHWCSFLQIYRTLKVLKITLKASTNHYFQFFINIISLLGILGEINGKTKNLK